jgi:putative toxin-antitoxin system antitoxin component (TIGR02293 family)
MGIIGRKTFPPNVPENTLEIYDFVNNGIPKVSVDIIAAVLEIPMTKMANLLHLSYKTLTRKNKKDLLDPLVSSHTYEMSNVIAKGLEVFEDGEKLKRWLHKENRALKGRKPFDLLNTPTGIGLVNQILGRLEEGIYS